MKPGPDAGDFGVEAETSTTRASSRARIWFRTARNALAVALVVAYVGFVYANWDAFASMLSRRPDWLPAVAVMLVASLCARAYFLFELLNVLGHRLPISQCFHLCSVSQLIGLFTPSASGAVFRAYYLHRFHGVGLLRFTAGSTLYVIVTIITWCILAVLALAAIGGANYIAITSVTLLVCLLAAGCLARSRARPIFEEDDAGVTEGAPRGTGDRFRRSRRVAIAAAVASGGSAIIQVLVFHWIMLYFAVPTEVTGSTLILASHQVSAVAAVTPGALGIQEGSGVAAAAAVDLDLVKVAAVLTMLRGARIIISTIIGVLSWRSLARITPRGESGGSLDSEMIFAKLPCFRGR